jgi:hypothetical protein
LGIAEVRIELTIEMDMSHFSLPRLVSALKSRPALVKQCLPLFIGTQATPLFLRVRITDTKFRMLVPEHT